MSVPVSFGIIRGFSMNDGAKPAGSSGPWKDPWLVNHVTNKILEEKRKRNKETLTGTCEKKKCVVYDNCGRDNHFCSLSCIVLYNNNDNESVVDINEKQILSCLLKHCYDLNKLLL